MRAHVGWIALAAIGIVVMGIGAYSLFITNDEPEFAEIPYTGPAVPTLTDTQREKAEAIVRNSQEVEPLIRGQEPKTVSTGAWTNNNQGLLGATVELKLEEPTNYSTRNWVRLANAGDSDQEDGSLEAPQTKYMRMAARNVTNLSMLVHLESGRVLEVLPMGARLMLRSNEPDFYSDDPTGE